MINGPIVRNRQHQKQYLRYLKQHTPQDGCVFCTFSSRPEEIISEYPLFYVAATLFKYDMWDGLGVVKHFMIVPKRHIIGISDFTEDEVLEFHSISGDYERLGYSLYQRAPANFSKSVAHQHSHIILLDEKPKKFVVYVGKPHISLYK